MYIRAPRNPLGNFSSLLPIPHPPSSIPFSATTSTTAICFVVPLCGDFSSNRSLQHKRNSHPSHRRQANASEHIVVPRSTRLRLRRRAARIRRSARHGHQTPARRRRRHHRRACVPRAAARRPAGRSFHRRGVGLGVFRQGGEGVDGAGLVRCGPAAVMVSG